MEAAKNSPFASQVITEKTFEEAPEEENCPWEVEYLWDWYCKLSGRRQSGMAANPLLVTEIRSWAEGMRKNMQPFELDALIQIDDAFISYLNTKDKTESKNV